MDPFKSIAQKEMQRRAAEQKATRGAATERHVPEVTKKPDAKAASTAPSKKPTKAETHKKPAKAKAAKEVIPKPPVEGYSASEFYVSDVLLKEVNHKHHLAEGYTYTQVPMVLPMRPDQFWTFFLKDDAMFSIWDAIPGLFDKGFEILGNKEWGKSAATQMDGMKVLAQKRILM